MKFVSKFSNHRVVLVPSTPPEPLTGRLATSGLSVRFENGTADVNSEEMIQMLLKHPRFGRDFVAPELLQGKNANNDPFAQQRRSSEPEHTITEIQYGHIGKSVSAPRGILTGLSTDKAIQLQKAIDDKATQKAMQMAPELAKQLLMNPEFIESLKKQFASEESQKNTGEDKNAQSEGLKEAKESGKKPVGKK